MPKILYDTVEVEIIEIRGNQTVKQNQRVLRVAPFPFGFRFSCLMTRVNLDHIRMIKQWCRERFGPEGHRDNNWQVWAEHDLTLWFWDEHHALEFKLRWV